MMKTRDFVCQFANLAGPSVRTLMLNTCYYWSTAEKQQKVVYNWAKRTLIDC